MKPTTPDRIRNVALISHGGAGKTSLAEAMLFDAGAIQRLGSVDAGTATLDNHRGSGQEAVSRGRRQEAVGQASLAARWMTRLTKANEGNKGIFAPFPLRPSVQVREARVHVVPGVPVAHGPPLI